MSSQSRVSAFIDAFNRMDIDAACDMLAEDVVYHNIPMAPVQGREAARAFLKAMPNLTQIEWEVLNTAENGDTVLNERVDRFFFADGKTLTVRVMGVFKIRGDEIVEWRDYFDLEEFQSQNS